MITVITVFFLSYIFFRLLNNEHFKALFHSFHTFIICLTEGRKLGENKLKYKINI